MTEKVAWHVVREFAAKAAIDKLAPHDLVLTLSGAALGVGIAYALAIFVEQAYRFPAGRLECRSELEVSGSWRW